MVKLVWLVALWAVAVGAPRGARAAAEAASHALDHAPRRLLAVASCVGGPGTYKWTTSNAPVGVTRNYIQGGLLHKCVCVKGTPPHWSCSTSTDYGIVADYNSWRFSKTATGMKLTMDPNFNGVRVHHTWSARSAVYCADITPPAGLNPGGVFSFYTTTGAADGWASNAGPWDELDLEWLLKTKTQIWINAWHNGVRTGNQEGYLKLPFTSNGQQHRYCLDWDLGTQTAKWIFDGRLAHTFKFSGWTKPHKVLCSFWGKSEEWSGFSSWPTSKVVDVANIAYEIRRL